MLYLDINKRAVEWRRQANYQLPAVCLAINTPPIIYKNNKKIGETNKQQKYKQRIDKSANLPLSLSWLVVSQLVSLSMAAFCSCINPLSLS